MPLPPSNTYTIEEVERKLAGLFLDDVETKAHGGGLDGKDPLFTER